MPYNGSGTFTRVHDWTTDEGNSVNIEASRMDAEDDGFATGLSNCITKDGQTTVTANIPFNSKKITGLGNGSARTDAVALGQIQDNTYGTLGTLGGSADTYTASPSPSITAYATGMEFNLKVNADNTGASTLNISAVGAKNIKKYDGVGSTVDLESGDLQQDQYYKVIYDGTQFIVFDSKTPYSSETIKGLIEIATQSEVDTGTDTERAVVPNTLSSYIPTHETVAKAWVVFNASGTLTVRDSYNVSSVVDNGVGDFTINFSTSFADADYCFTGGMRSLNSGSAYSEQVQFQSDPTASSIRIRTSTVTPSSSAFTDPTFVSLIFFGNQ